MPNYTRFLFSTLICLVTSAVISSHQYVKAADTTTPTTTRSVLPAVPNGKNSWYVTPLTYTLNATDLGSGVKEINYRVDSNPWQKISFADTLNLAVNPSFETADGGSNIYTQGWVSSGSSITADFSRDLANYASGFETVSVKISSTSPGFHSINNYDNFAVTNPYNNMTASVWLKTSSASGGASYSVYAISQDQNGVKSTSLITQSSSLVGTNDWTKLSTNFVVNAGSAIGVYLDIGVNGVGTVWVDAVNISDALTTTSTDVSVGADGSHTLYYYSVDQALNTEATKSVTFKIDQTPPGNWHDSGAIRGLFGTSYQLWVYATVEDETSGISPFTDKYQIHTEVKPGYGRFSNFLDCGSTWYENQWLLLITPPWSPGAKSAYIITPKTSFCNSNWNKCKIVRFYSEDMAGNNVAKDFCINGPWIKLTGEGVSRGNGGIDMLSEAEGDNTDGLIESGDSRINFYTSTRDWKLKEYGPPTDHSYDTFWDLATGKSELGSTLPKVNGVYYTNSSLTIDSGKIPSGYNTSQFSQVIFVNGDLTVNTNIGINSASAVLYVVKGNAKIRKDLTEVSSGILADGDFQTAYDMIEGDSTPALNLRGIFSADKFKFQRTLMGTNNSNVPSENITYEPKYIIKLLDYLGANAIKWLTEEENN